METKWLEDFISLAQTRSFSRSAQLRHVTQPAFSRRMQALEAFHAADHDMIEFDRRRRRRRSGPGASSAPPKASRTN